MKANGARLICVIILSAALSTASISTIAEESDPPYPGEVILVLSMPLHNGTGNSSTADSPPHLIELHTATWCVPCRSVESEVEDLEAWWPALEVVALHPSLGSPDELVTNCSSEVYNHYQLGGYPTLVIDGHWTLMGDKQAADLQPLLNNLSGDNLPRQGGATLTFDWQFQDENLTLNWSLSSSHDVILDFLVTGDDVVWPSTSVRLDNVVRGGLTNQSNVGTESVTFDEVLEENLSITAIVRIAGTPELESGSETPLNSGLSDSWQEPIEARSVSPKVIAMFSVLILILAIVPMRHTVPVLFRRQIPSQMASDDPDLSEE
jgi:thiol-disulfide isomerase/thioredoxin